MAGHAPHTGKPPHRGVASGIPAGGPGQGPASGLAARGERPPFPPGNALHLSHGARAPRVYGALAESLAAGLTEDRPDLAAYPEAVAAWATAEAQAALLRRHLADVGTIDPGTGEPRPGTLTWLRTFEKAAAEHRATLGLDPRSEAALTRERAAAVTLAVDLTALAERGRAVLAARESAGIPAPPDLAGKVLAEVQAEGRAAWERAYADAGRAER
jgi:hypothetical protein